MIESAFGEKRLNIHQVAGLAMSRETVSRRFGMLISSLVAITMIIDGLAGLLRPQLFAPAMASDGWGPQTLIPVALLALVSGVLYAIPRTALLGAILITGFVGGALAAHLRVTQTLIFLKSSTWCWASARGEGSG